MAPVIPLDVRQTIRVLLEEGLTQAEVARRVMVSERTVKRIWKLVTTHGTVQKLFYASPGRHRKITPDMEEVRRIPQYIAKKTQELFEWLSLDPSKTIDEMIYFLWDTYGVHVSQPCISRLMKRERWNKKKVRE
jgi:transposase